VFKQQRLDNEREFREEQAQIIQEAALGILRTEADLAQQQLDIQANTDAEKLESARRTQEQAVAYQNAQLSVVSEYVSGVSKLLAADTENRKKYGNILKVLALAEIAINLRKELSAISLAAIQAGAATGPLGIFAAGGIYAVQAAAAIVKAALNSFGVIAQKFQYGGTEPSERSSASSGGSIPVGSGMISGKSHAQGGVKAIFNKRLVEFEGGEYRLRNGDETYIINKRSTRKFKDVLLRLSDSPGKFKAARKYMASQINSYAGWGKPLKYAQGGQLDISPLSAPQVSTAQSLILNSASREEVNAILNLANSALAMADAANNRIDNLKVINDPLETIDVGSAQAEIRSTRNL
jgi:hypothetical protein